MGVGKGGGGDWRPVVQEGGEPRVLGEGGGQHPLDLGPDIHRLVDSHQSQGSAVTSVTSVTSVASKRSSEPIEILGRGAKGTNQPEKLWNFLSKVCLLDMRVSQTDLGESVHVAALRSLLELIETAELHSIYMQC